MYIVKLWALNVKTGNVRYHKQLIYNIILTQLYPDNQVIKKSYNN